MMERSFAKEDVDLLYSIEPLHPVRVLFLEMADTVNARMCTCHRCVRLDHNAIRLPPDSQLARQLLRSILGLLPISRTELFQEASILAALEDLLDTHIAALC